MKEKRLENRSGEYRPVDATADRIIEKLTFGERGMRKLSQKEQEVFWNEHHLELAEKVFDSLYNSLKQYGIPKQKFEQSFVDLFEEKRRHSNDNLGLGENKMDTGRIIIRLRFKEELRDEDFVAILLHEGGHFFAARYLWQQGLAEDEHRAGAEMISEKKREYSLAELMEKYTPEQEESYKNIFNDKIITASSHFEFLSEGIVEKNAHDLFESDFSEFEEDATTLAYAPFVELIEEMCQTIYERDQSYKSENEVFSLFKEATFGKGDWLPLARAIEGTWGQESFHKFQELMALLDYLAGFFMKRKKGTREQQLYARYLVNQIIDKFLEVT